jgi:hypothetical protein
MIPGPPRRHSSAQQQQQEEEAFSICTLPVSLCISASLHAASNHAAATRDRGLHQRRRPRPAQSCHRLSCRIIHRHPQASTPSACPAGAVEVPAVVFCSSAPNPVPGPTVFPFARHALAASTARWALFFSRRPTAPSSCDTSWLLPQRCGAAQSDAAHMHANHPHPGR